jgi:translation initiation factor 6 (eIF-6)
MATRVQFENNNEVGVFARLTNAYCLVSDFRGQKDRKQLSCFMKPSRCSTLDLSLHTMAIEASKLEIQNSTNPWNVFLRSLFLCAGGHWWQ